MSRHTEEEVGEVVPPLPHAFAGELAQTLSSEEGEVDALVRRLERPVARQSPLLVGAFMLALAALVLMAMRPAPLVLAPEVVTVVEPAGTLLATGVRAVVLGRVDVLEDGEWLVAELVDGAAGFVAERPLAVVAGEVRVETAAGQLELQRLGDRVEVRVIEGTAVLRGTDGLSTVLAAGQRWVTPIPDPIVEAAPPVELQPVAVAVEPAHEPTQVVPRDAAAALAELLDHIASDAPSEVLLGLQAGIESDFPNAPETFEAITRVAEVRASRLPSRQAVQMLSDLRASRPGLPRRLDLLELQAEIAKDGLRDCGLALPAYRELAAASTGLQRAEAQAWRGICAHNQGFTAEAHQALESAKAGPLPAELRDVVVQALERMELLEQDL